MATEARETAGLIGSDKVEGTPVYDARGEKIGSIERVMIDKRSGQVAYAVLSFGGFLGIGSDYYPIPWASLKYDTNLGGYRLDITEEQLKRTFQTNSFGMFYLTQAALPHLKSGSAIVNCTSVTMYRGSADLLDYSATKGAITAFTRSLAKNLVDKGIKVNGVAPGPIWTPLNPFGGQKPEDVEAFGKDTPMGRPGQPNEVAPAFLFLACDDSSYMTGQVLHPDGGEFTSS